MGNQGMALTLTLSTLGALGALSLSCSGTTCPPLSAKPYAPETLNAQLDASARAFLASDSGMTIDPAAKRVGMSKIFDWYRSDFESWLKAQGVGPTTLVAYAARYLSADGQKALGGACGEDLSGCAVEFPEYDWSLNDGRR